MGKMLYDFSRPEVLEKFPDGNDFKTVPASAVHVERNGDESGLRIVFPEGTESFQMVAVDFRGGFDLNGDLGISQHGIHFDAAAGPPVAEFVKSLLISQISYQFLDDQMLESLSVFR